MNTFYPKPGVLIDRIRLDESCVIEASAGTGKTYTLERLIAAILLETETPLERILIVTFTRRATAEMKQRIRRFLGELLTHGSNTPAPKETHWDIDHRARTRIESALHSFDRAQVFTIHSFCQQWLTRYAFEVGTLFDGELVSEADVFDRAFYDVLRTTYATEKQEWLARWFSFVGANANSADTLKNDLLRVHTGPPLHPAYSDEDRLAILRGEGKEKEVKEEVQTAILQELYPAVKARIRTLKSEFGLYTYDDMIVEVHRVLTQSTTNVMLHAMRSAYDFGLVDEFQDTDPKQWDIFKTVFTDKPLYLIGDPKQSIYGFRGADISTYKAAVKSMPEPVPLAQNFRSTPDMINAYNTIFKQDFFSDNNVYKTPVNAGRNDICATDSDGQKIKPICLLSNEEKDHAALRSTIADEVANILKNPFSVPAEHGNRPLTASDIFVLTRTGKAGQQIARELARRGIKYGFYREEGLFSTHEATHVLQALAALADPDSAAKRRLVMAGPFLEVPVPDLQAADEDRGDNYSPRNRFDKWYGYANAREYARLFRSMLNHSGLVRREIFCAPSERRLTNYEHLFELILAETNRRKCSPEDLYRWFQRCKNRANGSDGDLQRLETEEDAVQIMTMHKCKGLEAHVVFVYDVSTSEPSKDKWLSVHQDGQKVQFLSKMNMTSESFEAYTKSAREEVERLYYVAITRAISRLYLPLHSEKDAEKTHYAFLNARLHALLSDSAPFLDVRPCAAIERTQESDNALQAAVKAHLKTWKPRDTLVPPRMDEDVFRKIRQRNLKMVSYSSLSKHKSSPERVIIEGMEDINPWAIEDGHLPRGAKSGTLLHEILEHIDFSTVLHAKSFEEWCANTAVADLIDTRLKRSFRDPERYRKHTFDVIYNTLTAHIDNPYSPIEPLAALNPQKVMRELKFTFAIPEESFMWPELHVSHTIHRGFARGVIDLLFEHDSRLYFADWKSDGLEWDVYTPETLKHRVNTHYPVQAVLYTMALIRMLKITTKEAYEARFGGFYYFFMRGMKRAESTGVYYERPSWEDVQRQLENIRSASDWKDALREEVTQ